MWTIYTRTIPALRRRVIDSDLETGAGAGAMRKERKDVRWSAYKLWSDLVFVCKSFSLSSFFFLKEDLFSQERES
jgi:hypothetical protein